MASVAPARELTPWLLYRMAVSAVVDPATNGPFPVRFRAIGARDIWQQWLKIRFPIDRYLQLCDVTESPLVCDQEIQKLLLNEVESAVLENPENRNQFVTESAHIITVATAYWERRGSIIDITPALSDLLLLTDLTHDLPASMLRLPFPALYFENLPIASDYSSNVEGAFLFEHKDSGNPPGTRSLTLVPVRHNQHGKWVEAMTVSILDETVALVDALRESTHGDWSALFESTAKILIYMGLRDARQRVQTPYTDAPREFSGLGKRKRNLRLEAIEKLYDHILVGPDNLPSALEQSQLNGHVLRTHWRRGHFRNQPYGPWGRERRLIFIAPVLVNSDGLNIDDPIPKSYRSDL